MRAGVVGEDILKKVELGLYVKDAFGQACTTYQERQILCPDATWRDNVFPRPTCPEEESNLKKE